MSEEIPEGIPEEKPEDRPEGAPEELPLEAPEGTPEETPIESVEASEVEAGGNNQRTAFIVLGVILILAVLGLGYLAVSGAFSGQETPTPAPAESQITIENPQEGAVLDISAPVVVSGSGAALFEGNVIVQAIDQAGNILVESATTIQSPEAGTGGAGPWSLELLIPVAPGTSGQIYAYSTSPQDGSTTASDSVAVTFGEQVVVEQFIQIDIPQDGAVLDVPNAIPISGTAGGLFEGNLVVQALAQDGSVLVEQPTTVQAPDAGTGGQGPWSVELVIPVEPGTTGQIYAFSSSPADGSLVASDSVPVTYGEKAAIEAYITINQPSSESMLDISNPVTVNGMGAGLFEGNVVVQALAEDGSVLAEQPTIIQSPEAGVGGEGPWEVQLNIQATPGTLGAIRAFSPSPVDGSDMASASVPVSYGQVEEQEVKLEDHLWLLASLAGQEVLAGTQITAEFADSQVSGLAGCNNYFADYHVEGNQISFGPAGSTRMACQEPEGVMDQEAQYLGSLEQVASYGIVDGQLTLYNANGDAILVYNAAVIGTVASASGNEITEGAIVTVQLNDVSLMDVAATNISEEVITGVTGFPFPFVLTYDPSQIDDRFTYAVQIRITDSAGQLLYINTSAYNVITGGAPSVVEVQVDPV